MMSLPLRKLICIGITVYAFASCRPIFAASCSDAFRPQPRAQAEKRFRQFFLDTQHFRALAERLNKIEVDSQDPRYIALIESLQTLISNRVHDLEKILGAPETMTISSQASPGDLVIRFHRSKSFILLHLNKLVQERKYDDQWDRDYIVESRLSLKDQTEWLPYLRGQIEMEAKRNAADTICHLSYCLFFENHRITYERPPESYRDLNPRQRELVHALYAKDVVELPPLLAWSEIATKNGALKASSYKGGLPTYLRTRHIPKERLSHYRVAADGDIKVDLQKESFAETPWGDVKSALINEIIKDLRIVEGLPQNTSAREALTALLAGHFSNLTADDLYLLNAEARKNSVKRLKVLVEALRGPNAPLLKGLDRLALELEAEHETRYRTRLNNLLAQAHQRPFDAVMTDYFLIGDLKVPLVELSQLPPELREYFELTMRVEQVHQTGPEWGEDLKDGMQSIFRAPFTSEMAQIKTNALYDISTLTNFEPHWGVQVNHFRRNAGYSGEVLEVLNVPKFLLLKTETNGPLHPEVRFRFPVVTRQFIVHP